MRLLIVSNRLPFTLEEKGGRLKLQQSAGGLVSGLSAYLDYLKSSSFTEKEYIWVGWPGTVTDDKLKKELKSQALSEFHAHPVFLPEKAMEKFYHGFCNKTIWPLFHYFPSYAVYDKDYWEHYKSVNEIFSNAIMEIIKPSDIVWIHDYHLMLLPKLVREKMPSTPIGFFLHIPFPSSEIFQLLPRKWRTEILNGLLGADLVGFHTYDYTQYFLRCVLRILGYEHEMGKIVADRIVKADTFPMGIDFKRFNDAPNSLNVQSEKAKFDKALTGFKVILSIDRLDYTKGILNRLLGYEIFLENNPQWHKKVILVLIVVPSRVGVEHYQLMKKQIDELVGKITGRFGDIDWSPILYKYRFLPFHPLVALYNISDVALITPLRDGMNLIAKEYLSARTDGTGVLVLTETAGASKELGESIIVNPNNKEEIAEALKEALEMPKEEQLKRNQVMRKRLQDYDVIRWASDFISELLSIQEEQKTFDTKLLDTEDKEELAKIFGQSNRRLIFLDYDGTLVPFAEHPEMAKPTPEILELITQLSESPKNEVVLISGRDKNKLQEWLGELNINIVAEHGIWVKEKQEEWKMIKPLTAGWKSQLLPILQVYANRVPGSFVEEKDFSIAWHYRGSDPEFASLRAKELMDDLSHFTANIDVQVLQGSKVVEVRSAGVNKGTAAMHFISKANFDFIFAIGDDFTDEDLFKALPETAYSIRVGIVSSRAKFNVHNYIEVLDLIEEVLI